MRRRYLVSREYNERVQQIEQRIKYKFQKASTALSCESAFKNVSFKSARIVSLYLYLIPLQSILTIHVNKVFIPHFTGDFSKNNSRILPNFDRSLSFDYF